jgi:two-component system, OmpR family, KDP operon response regulator KdpE
MAMTFFDHVRPIKSGVVPDGASASEVPLMLIVADDQPTRTYLRAILTDHGFRVVDARTGSEAIQAAKLNPDLVLLAYSLPDTDGMRLTMKLRESTVAPIVVISPRRDEDDKVAALDAGANDYVTKPFGAGELLARIRVWLREAHRMGVDSVESNLEVGDLRLDLAKGLAFVQGREVRLTPTQYRLFAMFMRNAEKVLTHQQILLAIWGPSHTKERHYLRVYMRQLRKRIEADPAQPRYLVTEGGVGYRLRKP